MTPDPKAMAALHRACFNIPRPWSEDEIESAMASPGARTHLHEQGFLIGRVIADEAEILTLAVDPASRRKGIATQLVREFIRDCDAIEVFLEVAEDNQPARALYTAAGFEQAGRRTRYYGGSVDALVLRRTI